MLDTAYATPPSTYLTRSLLTALHAEQLRSPRSTYARACRHASRPPRARSITRKPRVRRISRARRNRAPVTEVSADQMRRTYETNVFGVVTVTNTLLPLLRCAEGARIVNVSSMLGSLSMAADPQGPFSAWPGVFLLAYNSSKTALNALTVIWASALREEGIKVNSADPGYVATDLNHHSGNSTVEQGAEIIVTLATLDGDGPSGTLQAAGSARPW